MLKILICSTERIRATSGTTNAGLAIGMTNVSFNTNVQTYLSRSKSPLLIIFCKRVWLS